MVKVTKLTKLEIVGVVSTTWLKHPFNEQTFHLKLGIERKILSNLHLKHLT